MNYREAHKVFNKAFRAAKRESWIGFSKQIEKNVSSSLKRWDETKENEKTLTVLLGAHFPECMSIQLST